MEEIWKPIKDFEDRYKVSNLGRVYSIRHHKIINGRKDKDGYIKINLYIGTKPYFKRLHRLVAEAFVPNPNNKPLVLHKKAISNGGDNSADNLYWGTQKENMMDKIKDGHCVIHRFYGKDNVSSKIVGQYDLQGNFIKKWYSTGEVARNFNTPCTNIQRACKDFDKRSAVGFKWKYL